MEGKPALIEQVAEVVLTTGLGLKDAETVFKRVLVKAAIARYEGNQCKAARALQVHRNTLHRYTGADHAAR